MEKVTQQFEFNQVDTVKDPGQFNAQAKAEQPLVLSLDCLDLVGGGDGEEYSAPTKGW